MAKKMSTGKVVALALCVIVGAGSIAALARGRDKDDEKEPAHVHDFSETNICADCGERQETILFSDVKVGRDLSGYSVRLTISEEEFAERFVHDEGSGIYFVKEYESGSYTISFNNDKPLINVDTGVFYVEDTSPVYLITVSGESVTTTDIVLSERFGLVTSIRDYTHADGTIGEALSYIEFYYVGLEPTSAAYARKSAFPASSSDALDGANIVLTDKNDSEYWTPFF